MGGHRNLLRGHYNPTPKQRKYPNLQYAQVNGQRTLICMRCLRTMHKGVKPTKATLPMRRKAAAPAGTK